jgi:excisionase family DNA binding protein
MQADLTAEEVAARLGVDRETVYRWLRQDVLRGYKLPRKAGWRILPQDVDAFIAAHMNKGPRYDAAEEKTQKEAGSPETATSPEG